MPVYRPPDDISTVVFTSGSTGLPKGAMFSYQRRLNELTAMEPVRHLEPMRVCALEYMPLTWMTARQNFYDVCMLGGALALFERPLAYLWYG